MLCTTHWCSLKNIKVLDNTEGCDAPQYLIIQTQSSAQIFNSLANYLFTMTTLNLVPCAKGLAKAFTIAHLFSLNQPLPA
jgi:hypothetical protein